MSVLIFHWLVCRISKKLKLKRFYDHVNRPFDYSLAVGVNGQSLHYSVAGPAWGLAGVRPPPLLVKILHFHAFFGIK